MAYYCGVDIGSSTVKLVITDGDHQVLGRAIRRSGINYARSAELALE